MTDQLTEAQHSETLDKFLNPNHPGHSILLLDLMRNLRTLFNLCAVQATRSGFHDDEQLLRDRLVGDPALMEWTESQLLQAELARIGSEVGEAVEGVRKPGSDPHLPHLPAHIVELADIIIRIGDTVGKRDQAHPLAQAIIEKMQFNATRPRKHGKGS